MERRTTAHPRQQQAPCTCNQNEWILNQFQLTSVINGHVIKAEWQLHNTWRVPFVMHSDNPNSAQPKCRSADSTTECVIEVAIHFMLIRKRTEAKGGHFSCNSHHRRPCAYQVPSHRRVGPAQWAAVCYVRPTARCWQNERNLSLAFRIEQKANKSENNRFALGFILLCFLYFWMWMRVCALSSFWKKKCWHWHSNEADRTKGKWLLSFDLTCHRCAVCMCASVWVVNATHSTLTYTMGKLGKAAFLPREGRMGPSPKTVRKATKSQHDENSALHTWYCRAS